MPDFNAGAMENPGCVTLPRPVHLPRSAPPTASGPSARGVIAHEMAHMWFGDLVTMRWWDDLWLNESFAEYLAQRCCSEATRIPGLDRVRHRPEGLGLSRRPVALHPSGRRQRLRADAASALQDFDGISYAKGAAVLKQLDQYLGDQVFLGGLRSYFADFAYGNAAFADLIAHWTASRHRGARATTVIARSISRPGRRAGSERPAWTPSTCWSPHRRS